ncbi:MAG TPA: TetR/AcrR family transcriptional regulator [Solirubrobacteraceae bacterium]|jgi:AcrR family transcriptional regulator|nr:TetR/AcrR family transcriptional regulator [Solirubrobacteraceae bacterium]
MIESAALLFSERGVQGTSFTDVLAHSGAPRGSIYHHFSGGKTQLVEEATRWAGEFTIAGAVAAVERSDPVAAVGTFCRYWSKILRASDFGGGCPIAWAALEGSHEPTARDIAGEVFADWEEVIAGALLRRGVAAARGRSIATLLLASLEGAIVLCRAQRSLRPLERVSDELKLVMASAFEAEQPADVATPSVEE